MSNGFFAEKSGTYAVFWPNSPLCTAALSTSYSQLSKETRRNLHEIIIMFTKQKTL